MSTKLLNSRLGVYQPSFFFMKINVDVKFEEGRIEGCAEDLSVFFHEYIHYLQDISTTDGYMNMHAYIERLYAYLYRALNCPNEIIPRTPLRNIKNSYLIHDIRSILIGDADEFTYESYDEISIIDVILDSEILENYEDGEKEIIKNALIPTIKLKLKSNDCCCEKDFMFGALAVKESMANLIEKHLYPSNIKDNYYQIQYDIAEKLYAYKMGNEYKAAHVVELCDISLLYNNPGMMYYSILECMRIHRFSPLNKGDIHAFVNRNCSSYMMEFTKNYNAGVDSFKKILSKKARAFTDLRKYTLCLLEKAKIKREEQKDFLYRIMYLAPEESLKYLQELAFSNDLPFIIDKYQNIYGGMKDTEGQCNELFYVAYYALYNILDPCGKKQCELSAICKKNIAPSFDSECDNLPWGKKENDIYCPVELLWDMWGLGDKKII